MKLFRRFSPWFLFPCILFLLQCYFLSVSSSVIGIDIGAEWMKVSIVKPKTFDIVLNPQSSRKTPTMVGFYRGERVFGEDAKNLMTRTPQTVFHSSELFLGRTYDDPIVADARDHYAFPLVPKNTANRGTIFGFELASENITFSAEDLTGMLLSYIKDFSTKSAGRTIKDCVITVPPYYNQAQRQAILDACQLAGLNVLALLNENAAAALQFSLNLDAPTTTTPTDEYSTPTTNIIVYDMGASKTSASLLQLKRVVVQDGSKKNANKTTVQLQTQEIAYDQNLGGRDFDRRLAAHWKKEILKQRPKAADEIDARAWAKLLREAQKAKEVLSALKEHPVVIEGLTPDFDFKTHVTREQFETLCADLFVRAKAPLQELLRKSGLKPEEVQYVEIVGGGVRVPRVQQELQTVIGRDLDKHINGDEGSVLGAVFYGASLSASFRVKEFKLKDMIPWGSSVTVEFEGEDNKKSVDLFKAHSRLNSKKTLNLSAASNFTISLQYDEDVSDPLPPGTRKNLGKFDISGLPTTEQYNFTGKPKLAASFRLNTQGIYQLDKIEAEVTVISYPQPSKEANDTQTETEDSSTPEATPESSGTSEEPASESTPEAGNEEGSTPEEVPAEETPSTTNQEESIKETKSKEVKPIQRVHRVQLKVAPVQTMGMITSEFEESQKILKEISRKAELKAEQDKAKNNVESYIYETREKLQLEDYNSENAIFKVTTEEQRSSFLEKLNEVEEWLYGEGTSTTAQEYRTKLKELKQVGDKMFSRAAEYEARPQAIETVTVLLSTAQTILGNITETKAVTEEERDEVLKSIAEATEWIQKKSKEQEETPLHEEPVVHSEELMVKWKDIEKKLKPLMRRGPKKVKKPEVIPPGGEAGETEGEGEVEVEGEEHPAEDQDQEPEKPQSETEDHVHDEL